MPQVYAGCKDATARIAEALKIDRSILSITLSVDCYSPVTAIVRFPLTDGDLAALEPELRRYFLVEQTSPAIQGVE